MTKIAVVAISLALALLGACADDGEGVPSDGSIEVTVQDGEVSGHREVSVGVGTEVSLEVTSDTADRIHVHGYDLYEEVPAGGSATVEFTADIPGVFEVELEDNHLLLLELTVE